MIRETAGCALVVIPARGGSKGVRRKNLQKVGGISLIGRAVRTAFAAPSVCRVVVSTDDDEIADEAVANGAEVVRRPSELAGDEASSESAVLHVLDTLDTSGVVAREAKPSAVTVLLQCTSPFINPDDLEAAIRRVATGQFDSVFSGAETHDFQWRVDEDVVSPIGHSASFRQRRQDRAQHFRETGAFYVMDTDKFRASGTRFSGTIGVQAVDPYWSLEVDTESDLKLARKLSHEYPFDRLRFIDVDALVTDFDGVHTPNTAYVDTDGNEMVQVSRSDGMGVSLLRKTGFPVLILSSEKNPVVLRRAEKLGVDVINGAQDKVSLLHNWIQEKGLDPSRVAFVGNDVNDLSAMALVGWPIAVADAVPEVLSQARVTLSRKGGAGAIRELCDIILANRGVTSGSTR